MKLKRWGKVSSKVVYKNPWWSYIKDKCKLPDGKEYEYHWVHTFGSSFVIPITSNKRIILVKQYRYLNNRFSLEFPGGGIKNKLTPLSTARKELIEETGYNGVLRKVGYFNPYNGITNEICHVYIATNLFPSNKEIKDDSEEFELYTYTLDEIDELIFQNKIYDGMTMAAWAIAKKKIIPFL